jgi:HEAT repeat protein
MNTADFIKEHQWEIIFALVIGIPAAILIPLFWEPIKKFLVSILNRIKRVSATKKFEHRYREWLINKYRFLNVRGIKTNASVTIELEKIFISLRTKKPAEKVMFSEIESKMKEEGIDKIPEIEEFNRREFLKRRIEERGTEKTYELKDLFNPTQKRFIIIGAPGSGKTTLLNYLALKFARKSEKELFGIENEFLPVFINLRDTTKEGFLDVRKFVENYNNYMECPQSPPEDFFKKKLDEGNCIILLDGLDEVASAEQRVNVAKWVDELVTVYPKNIYIATSRPYGYESAHLYNDFLELHILNFTPEQVEEFVRYWAKAVEIKARGDDSKFTLKEAEKEADNLIKAIKEHPEIEALTTNPLLLTIVSLVHRYRGHLPERRVELYDECCDVLLFHWDSAKGIAGELKAPQKRLILQPMAFHLHKNGLREEKKEKVIEFLDNELPKIGVSKNKASELLEEIRDRCGILVETKLGYFGFTHPTFQEFLTARYISDNGLEHFLVSKKKDKYWLEVTLLYCGMKETTNLLNKILKEKEDIFYTNLFLAGRCLAESLSINPELRDQIVQNLIDIYLDENELDTSKKIASEILKEVKDQKIVLKFMEFLKDKERYVRRCAANFLRQIQAKEAVLPLIELLKDKESDVRLSAASALGQIQAKEAVLPLIELLKDKESTVRGHVASALGQIKAKEAVLPLIELLEDKESDVRRSAASALGQIKAKEAVLPLIELLKDKEINVRWSVASALGQIQAKEAVLPLIELLKDEDSDVIEGTAFALGQMKAKEAVLLLSELLEDRESDLRGIAVYALGQIQAKNAVPLLIELLKDKDSYIRGIVAHALGQIQAKEAALPLIELLKDKEGYVRVSAVYALGQIQAKEAILPLIELLEDEDSDVIKGAVYSLGQMQAKEAVLPLIELLKDENNDIRETASAALGQIQAKEAIMPLLKLLKDKEGDVRENAAFALGQIQAKEAALPLIELLKDKEGNVRDSAVYALGQIQVKEAILPLIKLLKDKEGNVRGSAADALGQMQAKEAILPLLELLKDKEFYIRWRPLDTIEKTGDIRSAMSSKLLSIVISIRSGVPGSVRESAFNALKEISEKTGTPIYRE